MIELINTTLIIILSFRRLNHHVALPSAMVMTILAMLLFAALLYSFNLSLLVECG